MRDTVLAVYHGSGLSAVESPWIASVIVFGLLSVLMFALSYVVAWAHRASTLTTWLRGLVTALVVLGGGMATVFSVGLESFVRGDSGLTDDSLFSLFWVALFVLATVPFWLVLWRSGVLGQHHA